MKTITSRRQFLAEVGQGMLIASVGYAAAVEMGLSPAQPPKGLNRWNSGRLSRWSH